MKDTDVLQPGSIFLAAMDGGHAANAGSNFAAAAMDGGHAANAGSNFAAAAMVN